MSRVKVFKDNIGKLRKAWQPTGIICHRYKLIYYSVPKVACTSLKEWLARLDELPPRSLSHDYDFQTVTGEERRRYPDYISFAFVRNPWDRLFSCYRSKILSAFTNTRPGHTSIHPGFRRYNLLLGFQLFKADMDFEDFVRIVARMPDWVSDEHFRSQYRLFSTPLGRSYADYIFHFEELGAGLAKISHLANLPEQALPRLNATIDSGYRTAYTEKTAALIAHRYRGDIRRFSYSF